jgi:hypothetical protein
VHLNSIKHAARRAVDPLGYNPLAAMAVYKDTNGKYYLWERVVVADANGILDWKWQPYEDFTDPVARPSHMADMSVGYLIPLASATPVYDFMANEGAHNIGAWIDAAAQRVGR